MKNVVIIPISYNKAIDNVSSILEHNCGLKKEDAWTGSYYTILKFYNDKWSIFVGRIYGISRFINHSNFDGFKRFAVLDFISKEEYMSNFALFSDNISFENLLYELRTTRELLRIDEIIKNYIKEDNKIMKIAYERFNKSIRDVEIEKVIFNDPATIIIWKDGDKTIVKCKNENFDPEKGLAMAIAKKTFGGKGKYYDTFKKWIPKKNYEVQDVYVGEVVTDCENENRFYLELPDGYRLIFENDKYIGRYNPKECEEKKLTYNYDEKYINTNKYGDRYDTRLFFAGKGHKIVCAGDCYHVKNIKKQNSLVYYSLEAAIEDGCVPCKHCRGIHKDVDAK